MGEGGGSSVMFCLKKHLQNVYLTLEISPFSVYARGFCIFKEVHLNGVSCIREKKALYTWIFVKTE